MNTFILISVIVAFVVICAVVIVAVKRVCNDKSDNYTETTEQFRKRKEMEKKDAMLNPFDPEHLYDPNNPWRLSQ